jgi:hypothetical protein
MSSSHTWAAAFIERIGISICFDRYALRSRGQICGFKVGGIHRVLGTGSDLFPDLSIALITMEVEVALGVMFFPAFNDNQLGFFPFLPTHGLQ